MRARACMLALGIAATVTARGGLARAAAQDAPDDLAVVKRAVAQAPSPAAKPSPVARAGQPKWLKVRVVDKATRKGRVTVNLPLALVRAFGDAPIDWRCGKDGDPHHRCSIRVSEVLEALEAGQELVEVDDEEHMVKVWVE